MDPTILLAIGERTVDRVARTGGELANALGARLVLAHVRGGGRSFNSSSGHEILDRAHEALPAAVEPERVEVGTPAHRLAELASEVGAALIVAGTRGRGRLASALRGSVSRTLVRRASCPVLIVSDRAPVTDPASPGFATDERSTIVAGLDDSPESPVAAAFARELAQGLDDRLLIVRTHAAGAPPAYALQAIAAEERARLMVIGARHGDRTRFPLSGSVVSQLPRLAPCPFVVVPEGADATLGRAGEAEARRAAADSGFEMALQWR